MGLILSNGGDNSKIKNTMKENGVVQLIQYLPMCKSATETCMKYCFFKNHETGINRGFFKYPNVRNKIEANGVLYKFAPDKYWSMATEEMIAAKAKCGKKRLVIRLNGVGDIAPTDHVGGVAFLVMARELGVSVYMYTKNFWEIGSLQANGLLYNPIRVLYSRSTPWGEEVKSYSDYDNEQHTKECLRMGIPVAVLFKEAKGADLPKKIRLDNRDYRVLDCNHDDLRWEREPMYPSPFVIGLTLRKTY